MDALAGEGGGKGWAVTEGEWTTLPRRDEGRDGFREREVEDELPLGRWW